MVSRAGGYYGTYFKGYRGMTQWDPLSPTIFNVVVKLVVCHWVSLADEGEEGPEGWGKELQIRTDFFYAYYRLS